MSFFRSKFKYFTPPALPSFVVWEGEKIYSATEKIPGINGQAMSKEAFYIISKRVDKFSNSAALVLSDSSP